MPAVAAVIIGQLLFTSGDLLARSQMKAHGFHMGTFISWWFVLYWLLRGVATFLQLYVLASVNLGRAMPMFSMASLILVNVLGWLFLGEVLPWQAYGGVMLAIAALGILAAA